MKESGGVRSFTVVFCHYCGKPNPDDASFCGACGKRIGGTSAASISPSPAAAAVATPEPSLQGRVLSGHRFPVYALAFGPDGRRLAFVSNRTGGGDIYILNLETNDKSEIVPFFEGLVNVGRYEDARSLYRAEIKGQAEVRFPLCNTLATDPGYPPEFGYDYKTIHEILCNS